MTYLLLKSTNLHCGSCSANLHGELEKIGVQNISINILNSQIEFEFDEHEKTMEEVLNDIDKTGFNTNVIESYTY